MNNKKWSICFLSITLILLLSAAMLTGVIDPFFHYHAPLESLEYPLVHQRYQNNGIAKNYAYDAMITGTSMTENFKASEFDVLFDATTIKTCFSGGTYEEVTAHLQRAMAANPNMRYIVYGIEDWFLYARPSLILADGEYPTYLYDKNPFTDVKYLLNKEVLLRYTLEVPDYTRKGNIGTTFDEYSSWEFPSGKKVLLEGYNRPEVTDIPSVFTPAMADTLRENLETNLLRLAKEYPDTQFLLFFPPYSILNWDAHQREGILNMHIDAMTLASEVLLEADNIHLFSFYTDYETVTDFDNYRDIVHYHSGINSLMLQRMQRDEYRLTKENYQIHWEEVRNFYSSYDYASIFVE